MQEQAQFQNFLHGLVKPIIDEAVQRAVERVLSQKLDGTQANTQADEFLNVESAAQLLGVTVQTVYQAKAKGTLQAYKRFGKLNFKRSQILEFLEAGATKTEKRG